jgi:hypothetical protein
MLSSGMKCNHLGLNVIIWDEMISSGANVIVLQSGANVIIWCYHVMLLSGMKCYHLELMLSTRTECYHEMLSPGANVIIWS